MDNHNKQTFNWIVKQGSIILLADNDKIHLEINKETHSTCLLTKNDAKEIISILTDLSRSIWEKPGYIKEPYTEKLYTLESDGKVYWDMNETRLHIGLNEEHNAIDVNYQGNKVFKLPINYSVEIIQMMTHFSNQL
ncbi:hypothetical protein [Chryseobacterium gwangjuense]|uniref:hypothetical protein n=1 Tax=Chryseobacterium gwangjuense TaxID=1069980 RepID=UPI001E3738A3|nr:hypothetical protein [Chryseobacterium gwangjuense]MCE3074710.1 hypothetical protein [Chryseobacterium gwangjuense]